MEMDMSKTDVFKMVALAGLIGMASAASALANAPERGAVFERIDADSDGQVTRAEMQAHIDARFARADADGDGFLTKAEILASRDGERAQRMIERLDTNGDGQLDANELQKAGEDRRMRRADRMLDRLDTNDDGKLSQTEMSAGRDPAKLFDRLDADNNGSLSAEEFAKARNMRGQRPKN